MLNVCAGADTAMAATSEGVATSPSARAIIEAGIEAHSTDPAFEGVATAPSAQAILNAGELLINFNLFRQIGRAHV